MFEITNLFDLPEKCMFFGYGSLMYYHGINGRGMLHTYRSNDELFPVLVKGLKRSMSAEAVVNIHGTLARFYSVDINKNSKVFGMLFDVHTLHDLQALLTNEGARPIYNNGHYHLYDISDCFDKRYCGDLPKLTLVCSEKEDRPDLYYPGYVDLVYNNLSIKYRRAFLETEGVYPSDVEIMRQENETKQTKVDSRGS